MRKSSWNIYDFLKIDPKCSVVLEEKLVCKPVFLYHFISRPHFLALIGANGLYNLKNK